MNLSIEDYARLYSALVECECCGARRGEFCANSRGKRSPKFWHGARGRAVDALRRWDPDRYKRMRDQVVDEYDPEETACGTF